MTWKPWGINLQNSHKNIVEDTDDGHYSLPLDSFYVLLKKNGFSVTIEQIVEANKVIAQFAGSVSSEMDLWRYLSPIFAKSEEEQYKFQKLFYSCFKRKRTFYKRSASKYFFFDKDYHRPWQTATLQGTFRSRPYANTKLYYHHTWLTYFSATAVFLTLFFLIFVFFIPVLKVKPEIILSNKNEIARKKKQDTLHVTGGQQIKINAQIINFPGDLGQMYLEARYDWGDGTENPPDTISFHTYSEKKNFHLTSYVDVFYGSFFQYTDTIHSIVSVFPPDTVKNTNAKPSLNDGPYTNRPFSIHNDSSEEKKIFYDSDSVTLKKKLVANYKPVEKSTGFYRLGILVAIFVIGFILFFRRVIKTRPTVKKFSEDSQKGYIKFIADISGVASPKDLAFQNQNSSLMPESGLNKLAWQMRKRIENDSTYLDLNKTVKKSINNFGLLQPVLTPRTQQVEFLALIDESRINDQQVKLFDYLVEILRKRNVFINKYYYRTEPKFCYNDTEPAGVTLEKLNNRYANHILLIFGNAHQFIYKLYPVFDNDYLKLISRWQHKAVITPISFFDWGNKEKKVLLPEIPVFPVDVEGQLILMQALFSGNINIINELKNFQDKFYEVGSVDFEDITELKKYCANADWEKVTNNRTQPGVLFQWIAALAVYPKIRWELILAIGKGILDKYDKAEELNFTNLLRIARITWMQNGRFPDYIRLELLKSLTRENEIETRKIILRLLSEIPEVQINKEHFAFEEKETQRIINEFNLFAYDPVAHPGYAKSREIFEQMWRESLIMDASAKIYLENANSEWTTLLGRTDNWKDGTQPLGNVSIEEFFRQGVEKQPIAFNEIFTRYPLKSVFGRYLSFISKFVSPVLGFLSQLFKSLWLFFPGILFLLLSIFCFWSLGQGKDIIIAFIDNSPANTSLHFNETRLGYFLIIGFWVYVSWYSSRIISYIKQNRHLNIRSDKPGRDEPSMLTRPKDEIGQSFLVEFPRIIGNACFLVLELAVLQLPVLSHPMSATFAWIIFLGALILLRYINHWIDTTQSTKPSFRRAFYLLLFLLIIGIVAACFFTGINILILLLLLLFFHLVFIFYTNLRRKQIEKKGETGQVFILTTLERTMDYFCIPFIEKGYFKWFLYISGGGIVLYLCNIISLLFARNLGPFPDVILAFAVLLAFGNVITAFSVRSKMNFHFILFLLACIIGGLHETHYVRTNILANGNNNYSARPRLKEYLATWLTQRNVLADSSGNGYDIYFVMANGGASRSGYWTASVLGKVEDASLANENDRPVTGANRFSDHVFCLSGTSGGGVGVATFFSLLRDQQNRKKIYQQSAQALLKQDYFTYTFARMLGPDFFNYIIPFSARMDRGAALEESFEQSAREKNDSGLQVPFYDNFSNFPALKDDKINLPILCINTTRMQDGRPGVVTNLSLDSATFNNRIDVVKLFDKDADISLASAAILGARFPYLSPAGRIGNDYFVDGGYFDNSGAGVVQEMIKAIMEMGKKDSVDNGPASALYRQVQKLHFKVLHITNSPVILDSANIKEVAPIKNDLFSPLVTILGAYDMQTTVNDARLINFIGDINTFTNNKADYTQISLYEDSLEWRKNPLSKKNKVEPSYAMNWFMSDTTLRRINKRLLYSPRLNTLIEIMKPKR